MDITQRNLLRLLRRGAFDFHEDIEPMSAWKWNRLFQMSQMHDITPWVYEGIQLCSDDFFLTVRPTLMQQFKQANMAAEQMPPSEDELQQLTNPILNRRLQRLTEELQDSPTFDLLNSLIRIARYMLTQGVHLKQMVELGIYLRTTRDTIDYALLHEWIKKLKMERIVKLEAALLMQLFGFSQEEIPFTSTTTDKGTRQIAEEIFRLSAEQASEWYFTQGKNVFVGSSNSGAMIWHVKHSAKYMHYYPSEAVTNFMANFAHSLSHIEE